MLPVAIQDTVATTEALNALPHCGFSFAVSCGIAYDLAHGKSES